MVVALSITVGSLCNIRPIYQISYEIQKTWNLSDVLNTPSRENPFQSKHFGDSNKILSITA